MLPALIRNGAPREPRSMTQCNSDLAGDTQVPSLHEHDTKEASSIKFQNMAVSSSRQKDLGATALKISWKVAKLAYSLNMFH